jgi:dienelactone hydrolase
MALDLDPLTDFDRWLLAAEGFDHPIYRSRTEGPPVILLHEAPNLTPEVADLARRIAASGFRVHMPSLVGAPGKPAPNPGLGALWDICIRREFKALAGGSTRPVVGWIRALVRKIAAEAEGAPVGIIGLCFSGGFALGAATEPAVAAAVASEPALPLLASVPLVTLQRPWQGPLCGVGRKTVNRL